jgi:germination protein M
MRFLAAAPSVVSALLLVGCMGDEDGAMTTTVRETVTETRAGTVPNQAPMVLTVYFLRDGKVAPVRREVITSVQVAGAALTQLLMGPTAEERADGLETAIPAGTQREATSIGNGVAKVDFSRLITNRAAQAQFVYTLTQFPTVRRVAFTTGPARGRRAYENETPAILVESPLPGEEVEPGFEASGTANTFEATFQYELRDASNKILSKDFVTATSGSGTRGTFTFKVPYEIASPTDGRLIVFELSAADGSRINEREIPLRLE